MLSSVRPVLAVFLCAIATALGALPSCHDDAVGGHYEGPAGSSGSSSGSGGGGGAGGGCPMGLKPLFTLSVTADDGPVPPDTHVAVSWNAAAEPVFALDDPKTWTADDETVLCRVPGSAPPTMLPALVCDLWTAGPTRVQVSAKDYAPVDQTFPPTFDAACGAPIPSPIAVTLKRLPPDGGVPPN